MSSLVERVASLVALLACVCMLCCRGQVAGQKHNTPTCRDDNGNPVDWFIAYKFPMIIREAGHIGSGAGYAYITSEISGPKIDDEVDEEQYLENFRRLLHEHLGVPMSATGGNGDQPSWTLSKNRIGDADSMIMRSLELAYSSSKPKSLNWIFYNDHPATPLSGDAVKPSKTRAHAKGNLLIDESNGDAMWLSHSVPQFPPPVEDPLIFPDNAFKNGQTFVCMSFDARTEGAKVASHLANMFAQFYHTKVSNALRKMIPELNDLKFHGERTGMKKSDRLASLDQFMTTHGGQQFELFSKSADLEGDLYAGWLTEQLGSTLYVESWRQGFGSPLDSECPRNNYQVSNVNTMRLLDGSKTLFEWPYTKDHSKWAISDTQEEGVVCLADINRMASQFKRGGGAVCIKDFRVWTVFSNTIKELEPCPYKPMVKSEKSKSASMRKRFLEKIKKLLSV